MFPSHESVWTNHRITENLPCCEADPPEYVVRLLRCGIPVPVFLAPVPEEPCFPSSDEESDCDCAVPQTHCGQSPPKLMKDFLCCPICLDPFIETTLTNCGHKFCKVCIMKHSKKNSDCPVCGTRLRTYLRSYSDDCLIESQLSNMEIPYQNKFRAAQNARQEELLKEHQRRRCTLRGKISKKVDSAITFMKKKSSSSRNMIVSQFSQASVTSSLVRIVAVASLIVLLLIWCLSGFKEPFQFFQYSYHAVKNYNGNIPDEWLYPDGHPSLATGGTETGKPAGLRGNFFGWFSTVTDRTSN